MPEKEERTFFFYSDGYQPQELGLGHLVFGTYIRPTKGRWCTMDPLSETELEVWANVQPRVNCCYISASLRGFGVSLSAIDLVKSGVSANKDAQHAVASKECRRISLKDPQKFLSEKVLAVKSTREKVQEWLSVSSHDYALRKLTPLGWWPNIWMLTGMYEFNDCASLTWNKKDVSVEADVAAEIMELLNIPLGASAFATTRRGLYTSQSFPGKSIWAAEYRLVDAEFYRVSSSGRDRLVSPLELPLQLRAIWSTGGLRDSGGQHSDGVNAKRQVQNNMAALRVGDKVSSEYCDGSEGEDTFWEMYAEVEEQWQDGFPY